MWIRPPNQRMRQDFAARGFKVQEKCFTRLPATATNSANINNEGKCWLLRDSVNFNTILFSAGMELKKIKPGFFSLNGLSSGIVSSSKSVHDQPNNQSILKHVFPISICFRYRGARFLTSILSMESICGLCGCLFLTSILSIRISKWPTARPP